MFKFLLFGITRKGKQKAFEILCTYSLRKRNNWAFELDPIYLML